MRMLLLFEHYPLEFKHRNSPTKVDLQILTVFGGIARYPKILPQLLHHILPPPSDSTLSRYTFFGLPEDLHSQQSLSRLLIRFLQR